MSGFTEKNTTQQAVIDLLVDGGWTYVAGKHLPRTTSEVLLDSDVRAAIGRLNPHLAGDADRVEAAVITLRRAVLSAAEAGLMPANELMTQLLRGMGTTLIPDTGKDEPFRVIDIDNPQNNVFLVSDEVTYRDGRYDVVLWVNGLPVVVGETKTPVSKTKSWLDGAKDIHTGYEVQQPTFFAPNLLSFSTDGKQFRYAGVRTPLDHWNLWGDSSTDPTLDGWPRVELSVRQLLAPATVINLIAHYAMFEKRIKDGRAKVTKLLPRYFQYETVEAIVQRVVDGTKKRGLIYHTQGSGKTLAMAWVATRLVLDPRMENPTVLAVADRAQLVTQTFRQFAAAGAPDPIMASSTGGMQKALAQEERGIIATTVHKFKDAGLLSNRANIIVLIDEAHRTQEGQLGQQMRDALPNAFWFGFTGTPISDSQRNTFKLFGDPNDPDWALSSYNSDRSIADGNTLPMIVVPRPVKFHIDKAKLDSVYDDYADEIGLTEKQKEAFARRVSQRNLFLHNPERIKAVVENIVTHFTEHIAPNGMKAQIVVGDQELCVKYQEALVRTLSARGLDYQSAVVISGAGDKTDLADFTMSAAEEEKLLDRFRTFGDPLSFLIVTAKLGTGFDAPIEGVLYLDKPMKLHTLFQTITRTNRPWTSPAGDFSKRFGTIVDYIGLGDGFARAIAPADPERKQPELEVETLIKELRETMKVMLARFVGVPREDTMGSLQQALERIPTDSEHRADFQAEFMRAQGLWETIAPNPALYELTSDYRWLAQVYSSIPSPDDELATLWAQFGAKTKALIHAHMVGVEVVDRNITVQISDADTIAKLIRDGKLPTPPPQLRGKSAQEIVDSLTERIRRRMAGGGTAHAAYRSIAERLDRLAEQEIQRAEDSIDWLTTAFTIGTDLLELEQADDAGLLDDLPDPRIGRLQRIFEEHRPAGQTVLVEQVVTDIDKLVKDFDPFKGWETQEASQKELSRRLRKLFRNHKLPLNGEPFASAWEYIRKHY